MTILRPKSLFSDISLALSCLSPHSHTLDSSCQLNLHSEAWVESRKVESNPVSTMFSKPCQAWSHSRTAACIFPLCSIWWDEMWSWPLTSANSVYNLMVWHICQYCWYASDVRFSDTFVSSIVSVQLVHSQTMFFNEPSTIKELWTIQLASCALTNY